MTAAITNRGSYPEHSKYDIQDFAMPWAPARAGLLLRGKVSGPLLRWGVSGYFGLHVSGLNLLKRGIQALELHTGVC